MTSCLCREVNALVLRGANVKSQIEWLVEEVDGRLDVKSNKYIFRLAIHRQCSSRDKVISQWLERKIRMCDS